MIPQNSFIGLKESIMPLQQQRGNVTTAMAPSCHGVERKHNRRRAAPLLFALHKIWRAAPRSCSKFQGARLRSPPGGEGYPSLCQRHIWKPLVPMVRVNYLRTKWNKLLAGVIWGRGEATIVWPCVRIKDTREDSKCRTL